MTYPPGANAPTDGIYWCTVCKLPEKFKAGQDLPECRNMCGRGRWELDEKSEAESDEA